MTVERCFVDRLNRTIKKRNKQSERGMSLNIFITFSSPPSFLLLLILRLLHFLVLKVPAHKRLADSRWQCSVRGNNGRKETP